MKLKLSGFRVKIVALYGALIGQGVGASLLDSAIERTLVVLGLATVIMWASSEVSITQTLSKRAMSRTQGRRFVKLRAQVDLFMADVKRLNWLAVDSDLGVRDGESTARDMNETTERMVKRVSLIRKSAGVEQLNEEALPADDVT